MADNVAVIGVVVSAVRVCNNAERVDAAFCEVRSFDAKLPAWVSRFRTTRTLAHAA